MGTTRKASVVCGDTFDQKTSAAEVDLATIQGRGS